LQIKRRKYTVAYVDLSYPVLGNTLPTDHGYALFSALSRTVPEMHQTPGVAIETIAGTARGDGTTMIASRATFRVRLPAENVGLVLPLAGKRLDVAGHAIRLGVPSITALKAATSLYARIVTIKGFCDPELFLAAAGRQLDQLGLPGELHLGTRRVLRIAGKTVVGFSLTVHDLTEDASISLQEFGIGGRRHMGAGFFVPVLRQAARRA
jgi:CRISPR-associated protein Cas6